MLHNLIRKIKPAHHVSSKITGKNNIINYHGAKMLSVIIDLEGNSNEIEIQQGCVLNNVMFYIRGDNHKILIEKGCKFYRGGNIWFEDRDCLLIIGQKSTFEDVHLAITEPGSQIKIGCDCMFAYDIDVRTGDSHSIVSQQTNERVNFAKNIIIGDHVWVAAHCNLLKGTSIAKNSVVATGSIVTKNFGTEGIIIGGNPARELKTGITWSRERIYGPC